MNDLQGSDSGAAALDTAKLLIYIMLNSLMKVHMQYFSPEAMQAIAENEKELLKNLGVSYRYVDVDLLEGEAAEKVMEDMHKYNPQTSFPTIVIDNGKKVILGFQEEEIRDYLS